MATTNAKVRFIEVTSQSLIDSKNHVLSATTGLSTSDIAFIPELNAIWHNNKYYGFTDAERNIIDTNFSTLRGDSNKKINTITVNGASGIISYTNTTNADTGFVDRNANLTLLGSNIPISSESSSTIQEYINSIASSISSSVENSVTSLAVKTNTTAINNTTTGDITIDLSANNLQIGGGSNITGEVTIKPGSTIRQGLASLNTEIKNNSDAIATLNSAVYTVDSSTTAALSTTLQKQQIDPKTTGTISLNSTNIVVGGGDITFNTATNTSVTIKSASTIRDGLTAISDRLSALSSVGSDTLNTLKKLEDELNNPEGAGIATSFLDKINALLKGFTDVVPTTVSGDTSTALKDAVQTMITNSIASSVRNFETISIESNTTGSTSITAGTLNSSGTINIKGNDLIIGSTVATGSTTTINATDKIDVALGKIRRSIQEVASSVTSGVSSIHNFKTIKIDSTTDAIATTATATTNNQTTTFNINGKSLVLGATSNAGVVQLKWGSSIASVIDSLNSSTKTALDSKLSSVKINGITSTGTGPAVVTLAATDIAIGKQITGATTIGTTEKIDSGLQKLDTELGSTKTSLSTLTTNVLNATTAINEQLVWYTL